MYDTVWDKKCEMVNVTVPQRDCDTTQVLEMDIKCRVVNSTVQTPVCVNVMDKVVEENCYEVESEQQCYQPNCTKVARPIFNKECREVSFSLDYSFIVKSKLINF